MSLPRVIALDYSGTLSRPGDPPDPKLGQRPVTPAAAKALRELHELGFRLVLASNTLPGQSRWAALKQAGVEDLFAAVVESQGIGVAKPDPEFYRFLVAACGVPADAWMVGDNLSNDVVGPLRYGFGGAVLINPDGVVPATLPDRAYVIGSITDLPGLLRSMR